MTPRYSVGTLHCEHRGDHYRLAEGYVRKMCSRPTEGRCPKCLRPICEYHAQEHAEKRHA